MWPPKPFVAAWTAATLHPLHFGNLNNVQTVVSNAKDVVQVVEPIIVPNTKQISFGNSYGHPFVSAFEPPTACPHPWSMIVLDLHGAVSGVQFDRVGAVWIGGAEAIRFTTAEPRRNHTTWNVRREISTISSILITKQPVVVALDNIVDSTYTGIFNISIKLEFYPLPAKQSPPDFEDQLSTNKRVPDLVVPISASTDSYGWFSLPNGTDGAGINLPSLPTNAIHAEIEVFTSGHSTDEFWYINVPDDIANNDAGIYGGTAFKEVQVLLDGRTIGLDWPYPTIYTGGFNPYLWSSVVSTGAFDVPSRRIDITPFLPLFFDESVNTHRLALNITPEANQFWLTSALLKIWTDGKPDYSGKFVGSIIASKMAPTRLRYTIHHPSPDTYIVSTRASNHLHASANITRRDGSVLKVESNRKLVFDNSLIMINNGSQILFNQTTHAKRVSRWIDFPAVSETDAKMYVDWQSTVYPLSANFTAIGDSQDNYEFYTVIRQGLDSVTRSTTRPISYASTNDRLVVSGAGDVEVALDRGALATSVIHSDIRGNGTFGTMFPGFGNTKQTYSYVGPDQCYARNIHALKDKIVSDKISTKCRH